jgi:L-fuconate dehydratase
MSVFGRFEVSDLRFPTSRDLDGSDAMNPDPDYSAAYLVVRTDAGEEGHGFVFTIGRGTDVAVAAIRAVEGQLLGRDVDEVLGDMGSFWRSLTHESQLRWLGPEKGVMHMAIGAVVNAVWDLKARRAGVPLWKLLADMPPEELVALVDFRYLTDALTPEEAVELLRAAAPGRAERENVLRTRGFPAYTTSAGWLGYSDEKVARLVDKALADGFDHLKLKVGADIENDVRRVKLVRDQVGPDVLISVDANQRWGVEEAVANVRRLAVHDLYWVEEPTSPDDIFGHRAIAEQVRPVRVATGEHVANAVVFKQLIVSGAIDVCQIDACRVAGVNENVAIILLAAKYAVPVCPHAGGVGLCEVVQHLSMFDYVAVAGRRDGRWIEYVDHLHEHFVDPVRIDDGAYVAPLAPGAGARVLAQTISDYRFPEGRTWSALRRQDGPETSTTTTSR